MTPTDRPDATQTAPAPSSIERRLAQLGAAEDFLTYLTGIDPTMAIRQTVLESYGSIWVELEHLTDALTIAADMGLPEPDRFIGTCSSILTWTVPPARYSAAITIKHFELYDLNRAGVFPEHDGLAA